jgi:hypothetical protein
MVSVFSWYDPKFRVIVLTGIDSGIVVASAAVFNYTAKRQLGRIKLDEHSI